VDTVEEEAVGQDHRTLGLAGLAPAGAGADP
jgi:hypothetical protein